MTWVEIWTLTRLNSSRMKQGYLRMGAMHSTIFIVLLIFSGIEFGPIRYHALTSAADSDVTIGRTNPMPASGRVFSWIRVLGRLASRNLCRMLRLR